MLGPCRVILYSGGLRENISSQWGQAVLCQCNDPGDSSESDIGFATFFKIDLGNVLYNIVI